MSQRVFGVGQICLTPVGGGTPIQVGVAQDISYDAKSSVKKLYGSFQVAIDAGAGEATHGGKIKAMQLNGPLIAALASGATITSGSTAGVPGEQWTIPATPYQMTVAHSATWVSDLGVWDITAQKYLTPSTTTLVSGTYSVANGVYTFYSGDAGHVVSICYDYTVAGGTTIKLINQPMGALKLFGLKLYNNFTDAGGTANAGLAFPSVFFSDQSLALKNTDFISHDITWEALADASGVIRYIFTGN